MLSAKQHFARVCPDVKFDAANIQDCKEYDRGVHQQLAKLDRIREEIWEWFISILDPDRALSQFELRVVQDMTKELKRIYQYWPDSSESCAIIDIVSQTLEEQLHVPAPVPSSQETYPNYLRNFTSCGKAGCNCLNDMWACVGLIHTHVDMFQDLKTNKNSMIVESRTRTLSLLRLVRFVAIIASKG